MVKVTIGIATRNIRRVQATPSVGVVHYHLVPSYDFLWKITVFRRLPCTTLHYYKAGTAALQRVHNKIALHTHSTRPFAKEQ